VDEGVVILLDALVHAGAWAAAAFLSWGALLCLNELFAPRLKQGASMKMNRYVASAAAAALFAGVAASWAQSGDHRMISPGELRWVDVPSLPPGAKIAVIEGPMSAAVPFTARLKFPANYRIPAHWHPAVERVTVLSGTFFMGMGAKLDTEKSMPLTPGSMMILQPRVHHFAWTKEEVVVQLNGIGPWGITYVNAADDPRTQ
jgi:hypothetical protein